MPPARNGLCSRTSLFAEVETNQETNNAYDHEGKSDEIEFTGVFSEALPLVGVKV